MNLLLNQPKKAGIGVGPWKKLDRKCTLVPEYTTGGRNPFKSDPFVLLNY
jgi:hypothetical protein